MVPLFGEVFPLAEMCPIYQGLPLKLMVLCTTYDFWGYLRRLQLRLIYELIHSNLLLL
jgi:hypothetical protein